MKLIETIGNELGSLGFTGSIETTTTFHELVSWIRRIQFTQRVHALRYEIEPYTNKKILVSNSIQYSDITLAMSGTFGHIYLVYREKDSNSGYVFLKAAANHPSSLLLEGLLQSIAYSVLSYYKFPKAIPRVLDILHHPDHGIVVTMERTPGARLFADYLKTHVHWGIPSHLNDTLILSVLAQIATYLAILEHEIQMNHRDLTGTNVLMVDPTIPVHQSVELNGQVWILRSNHQAILIDFGFACIGTGQKGTRMISAGEFLPDNIDFCPKQGRDLFLFFASLWNVEAFRSSMTEPLKGLFHKWLHDKTSVNWAQWLITSATTNLKSMYLLTNAEQFKSPPCSPIQVLRDISSIAPDLVRFAV